ncbi:MAG: putative transporter ATP-binding protein [Bacteroidota bacterium]|nr:putative transporter ATP-binding protein [Bacteroidota bacterium]
MNKTVIENIRHAFVNKRDSLEVIRKFSISVNEGETIAILGPSGCGKSTILRCIASLIKPLSGSITINNIPSTIAIKKKMIGFAFQEAALLEWETVVNNILLPGKIGLHTKTIAELEKKSEELISLMGLTGFECFYPSQLSGGMKQRVALARALLLEPSLLLLDEPFGSLDLLTRSNLIVEFSKIMSVNKIPTIIVTHSVEEAVFLADKVLILSPRPCSIIAEISPELVEEKSFKMFDDAAFITKVAECRKILLESWNNDKN